MDRAAEVWEVGGWGMEDGGNWNRNWNLPEDLPSDDVM